MSSGVNVRWVNVLRGGGGVNVRGLLIWGICPGGYISSGKCPRGKCSGAYYNIFMFHILYFINAKSNTRNLQTNIIHIKYIPS